MKAIAIARKAGLISTEGIQMPSVIAGNPLIAICEHKMNRSSVTITAEKRKKKSVSPFLILAKDTFGNTNFNIIHPGISIMLMKSAS